MNSKLIRMLLVVFSLVLWFSFACAENAEEAEQYKLPIDFTPGMPADPQGYVNDKQYEDPTISVKIEEGTAKTPDGKCSYWLARIKIADASQLRTMAAADFYSNRVMKGEVLARRANAVLAINGDYFCYTGEGYIIRQGETYLDILQGDRDVLAIDEDGDFHCFFKPEAGAFDGTVNGKKIINAFFFGPVLVHEGEAVKVAYNDEMASDTGRQRMALCQVGPLEYMAVCCAGPARGSTGMTLQEFANLCDELGAQTAYNVDGGDSTMLIFKGKKINDVYNKSVREIADIIYFASAWGSEK